MYPRTFICRTLVLSAAWLGTGCSGPASTPVQAPVMINMGGSSGTIKTGDVNASASQHTNSPTTGHKSATNQNEMPAIDNKIWRGFDELPPQLVLPHKRHKTLAQRELFCNQYFERFNLWESENAAIIEARNVQHHVDAIRSNADAKCTDYTNDQGE